MKGGREKHVIEHGKRLLNSVNDEFWVLRTAPVPKCERRQFPPQGARQLRPLAYSIKHQSARIYLPITLWGRSTSVVATITAPRTILTTFVIASEIARTTPPGQSAICRERVRIMMHLRHSLVFNIRWSGLPRVRC